MPQLQDNPDTYLTIKPGCVHLSIEQHASVTTQPRHLPYNQAWLCPSVHSAACLSYNTTQTLTLQSSLVVSICPQRSMPQLQHNPDTYLTIKPGCVHLSTEQHASVTTQPRHLPYNQAWLCPSVHRAACLSYNTTQTLTLQSSLVVSICPQSSMPQLQHNPDTYLTIKPGCVHLSTAQHASVTTQPRHLPYNQAWLCPSVHSSACLSYNTTQTLTLQSSLVVSICPQLSMPQLQHNPDTYLTIKPGCVHLSTEQHASVTTQPRHLPYNQAWLCPSVHSSACLSYNTTQTLTLQSSLVVSICPQSSMPQLQHNPDTYLTIKPGCVHLSTEQHASVTTQPRHLPYNQAWLCPSVHRAACLSYNTTQTLTLQSSLVVSICPQSSMPQLQHNPDTYLTIKPGCVHLSTEQHASVTTQPRHLPYNQAWLCPSVHRAACLSYNTTQTLTLQSSLVVSICPQLSMPQLQHNPDTYLTIKPGCVHLSTEQHASVTTQPRHLPYNQAWLCPSVHSSACLSYNTTQTLTLQSSLVVSICPQSSMPQLQHNPDTYLTIKPGCVHLSTEQHASVTTQPRHLPYNQAWLCPSVHRAACLSYNTTQTLTLQSSLVVSICPQLSMPQLQHNPDTYLTIKPGCVHLSTEQHASVTTQPRHLPYNQAWLCPSVHRAACLSYNTTQTLTLQSSLVVSICPQSSMPQLQDSRHLPYRHLPYNQAWLCPSVHRAACLSYNTTQTLTLQSSLVVSICPQLSMPQLQHIPETYLTIKPGCVHLSTEQHASVTRQPRHLPYNQAWLYPTVHRAACLSYNTTQTLTLQSSLVVSNCPQSSMPQLQHNPDTYLTIKPGCVHLSTAKHASVTTQPRHLPYNQAWLCPSVHRAACLSYKTAQTPTPTFDSHSPCEGVAGKPSFMRVQLESSCSPACKWYRPSVHRAACFSVMTAVPEITTSYKSTL